MDLKAMGNLRALFTAAIVVCAGGRLAIARAYQQTNLVSDIQGLAQNPPNGQADTQLLNPWGLVATSRTTQRSTATARLFSIRSPAQRSAAGDSHGWSSDILLPIL